MEASVTIEIIHSDTTIETVSRSTTLDVDTFDIATANEGFSVTLETIHAEIILETFNNA